MWIKYLTVKKLATAEMYKNVIEGEGLPVKIFPKKGILEWSEDEEFDIYVPMGRGHVADEIIRKL